MEGLTKSVLPSRKAIATELHRFLKPDRGDCVHCNIKAEAHQSEKTKAEHDRCDQNNERAQGDFKLHV